MKTKQKKKVLVFGGGGFIGSHLVESLISNYRVTIFDKKNFSRQNISTCKGEIEIIEGDFCNHLDWLQALNKADYVVHLICSTLPASSNENCTYDVESNIVPSLKLLDALREHPHSRLIFISSGGTVYGNAEELPITEDAGTNPICSYGIGKLMIEKYLHFYHTVHGLDYRTARLSNAYGERQNATSNQGLITTILHKLLQGQAVEIWGDGLVVRDYIYVKDAIDCIKKILAYDGPERTFNVSSNKGYSVREVVEAIAAVTGRKIKISYGGKRKFDVRDNILNNALAARELGWKPKVSLPEGIALVYEWLKDRAKE